MNCHLFVLIHNERPYKRYYGQPLPKDNGLRRLLHELKLKKELICDTIRFPFDNKYNTQQFPGERKTNTRIFWENICWAFKYK